MGLKEELKDLAEVADNVALHETPKGKVLIAPPLENVFVELSTKLAEGQLTPVEYGTRLVVHCVHEPIVGDGSKEPLKVDGRYKLGKNLFDDEDYEWLRAQRLDGWLPKLRMAVVGHLNTLEIGASPVATDEGGVTLSDEDPAGNSVGG